MMDVMIIGAGPAGLTAALYLGRARAQVLVLDQNQPRHAVSQGVHNFLTRDGISPANLRKEAWAQMSAYPSVHRKHATIERLEFTQNAWHAYDDEGLIAQARALLLATGVVDEHPDIPGYKERWGHAIHHCPYCHGWELRDRPLAILATGEAARHLAPLLLGWTDDVILLTHGASPEPETLDILEQNNIPYDTSPLVSLDGPGKTLETITLASGTTLQRQGLFVTTPQRQVPLITSLQITGADGYVEVDEMGQTSLPMCWAAGDLTTYKQQVVMASAQGARAAIGIHAMLTLRA